MKKRERVPLTSVSVRVGDIFETNMMYIVNPVNLMGVMGLGLAKEVRKRHPEVFKHYSMRCRYNKVLFDKYKGKKRSYFDRALLKCRDSNFKMGDVLVKDLYRDKSRLYMGVVSVPTKVHWKDKSSVEDIRKSLKKIGKIHSDRVITSISLPLIGSGLGGLDDKKVINLIIEEVVLWGVPRVEIVLDDEKLEEYTVDRLRNTLRSR